LKSQRLPALHDSAVQSVRPFAFVEFRRRAARARPSHLHRQRWFRHRQRWFRHISETIEPAERSRPSEKEDADMARKEVKKLDELFHDTLKDIYFAEKKILTVLPKMEKAAHRSELKRAFATHRAETEGHVDRLEKVFAAIDKKPKAKTCDAIVGITDEGAEIMKEYKRSPALDAGLLAAAQAVEHYEISRYGTLKTWAQELGLNNAARLLEETLMEEKKTDALLTEIAETAVNQEAEGA
jgi:ferritin-like metal-binding protein YciE